MSASGVTYFGVEDPIRRDRPRCSTPRTPSTAAAAARRTPTTPSISATSAATAARTAASGGPSPAVAAERVELHGVRSASFTAADAGGQRAGVAPLCPASTTSTTRSARGHAVPGARRRPAGHRGRPGGGERGVRPRGADRPRLGRAVDPADQEPGRRERGPAHAGARGRRARPSRGPQRPDRRRPRRLVGLGRRLRAPGRPRAPRHLCRHAGGRAGAAAEVRRDPGGAAARRSGPRGRA